MARKPKSPCKELRQAKLGDPLGLCQDFSPSYRGPAQDPTAVLQAFIEDLIGLPAARQMPSMKLDADLQLEEEDIESLLGPRTNVDVSLLLAQGTLGDLVRLVQPSDSRAAYEARLSDCDRILREDGEEAWRAAGCKRDGHLMLPRGRMSFTGPGERFPVGPATKQRWKDEEPPLGARTQSPEAHAFAQARKGRLGLLAGEIEQGLIAYAMSSGQPAGLPIALPPRPGPLVAAGVPPAAAKLLLKPRQGTHVRAVARKKPASDLNERLLAIFGLVPLQVNHEIAGVPQGTYFDLSGRDLRRVRSTELHRRSQPGVKDSIVDLMVQLRGPKRPKKARRPTTRQRLYVWKVQVDYTDGRKKEIPLRSQHGFWTALDAATRNRNDWTLVIDLGDKASPRTLRLQHSVFSGPTGAAVLPDYTTLRGLALPELALALAQRLVAPRKRRRGRRQDPLSAKTNPVSTYTLTAEMTAGMKEGDARPYTPGATLDPPQGQFIYWSKRKGPQVVSAARLASWAQVARRGRQIHQLATDEATLVPVTHNPRSPQRKTTMARRRKTRRNPQMQSTDLGLSSNRTLNKYTDWYYPGTAWDYYEAGEYDQYNSSVPVNRRNPRRQLTQKQILAGFGGKAAQAKARSAKRNSGARKNRAYKEHSTSVHQYRDSGHKANASKAMGFKHDFGISLKEAWAHVKGGTTPTRGNPRRVGGSRSAGYWPRHSPYSQVLGPYGASAPLSPSRRNPRGGKTMVGRFPSPCFHCGESMKGHEIHQVGVGPRGGKQMAHVNCGR